MGSQVVIQAELSTKEASALLQELKANYRLILADQWYADAYRFVPEKERHAQILQQNPTMAARKRLIGALSFSLQAAK